MASEEYIDIIKMMMENQDRYFNWFLAILSIVLVFAGVVQWRFSSKQIEQLKETTKQELIQEIEETLGVSNLPQFKNEIQESFKKIESERNMFEHSQLDYEILKLSNQEHFLGHLIYLMDIYRNYLLRHFGNFNYFMSRAESLIVIKHHDKKVDIHSQQIDKLIEKMSEFESTFNEKSEKLKSFNNQISFYRKEQNEGK